MAHLTPEGLAQQLRLMHQWIVIYLGPAYTQLPVVTFTREAIQLEGAPRQKLCASSRFCSKLCWLQIPTRDPSVRCKSASIVRNPNSQH